MMKRILNFGSLNLDYVYAVEHFVAPGETISSSRMDLNCGGKGLNQSIALAKAGAKVCHAGKIGFDGGRLKTLLESYGVDTSYLKESEGPNGHAIIQVDKAGQNCILLFPGSNRQIEKAEIDACLDNFGKGDYLLLQNEINLIPYIMEKAAEKGIEIVFNPSPITEDIFSFPLDKVSLFILNEIEGKALSGEDEAEKILCTLHEKYPAAKILLTLGEEGSLYFDGEKKIFQNIYKVKAVDTTAAGDTTTGYFLAGLAAGDDPATVLDRAARASSITVTRHGAAESIPTKEEVL